MNKISQESILELTPSETSDLNSCIQFRGTIFFKGVVEFYYTKPPNHSDYNFDSICVLVLLLDYSISSHIIYLYSLKKKSIVAREEMYINFEIVQKSDYFLAFEGKNSIIGLNFVNSEECKNFSQIVSKCADNDIKNFNVVSPEQNTNLERKSSCNEKNSQCQKGGFLNKLMFPKKKKSFNEPIKKIEIGNPYDFKHIKLTYNAMSIPGYNPTKGFTLEECEMDWLVLFVSLKLNSRSLKNPTVAKEIVSFVEQHGGIKKISAAISEKDTSKSQKSKSPQMRGDHSPSPRQSSNSTKKPSIIKNSSNSFEKTAGEDEDLYMTVSPCPSPPPPPPPSAPPPPPPSRSIVSDSGHLSTSNNSQNQNKPQDERNNLLDQINSGTFSLKKSAQNSKQVPEEEENSIVGILAARLKDMNEKMADSDEESGNNSNDEWE